MINTFIKTDINNTKETKLPVWEMIVITFFLFYYLLPSASNSIPFIIAIGVALVYLFYIILLVYIEKSAMNVILMVLISVIFVTLCYYLLTQTKTIDTSVSNYDLKRFLSKFQQLFFTFFPLLLLYRLISLASKTQIKYLLIFAIIIILYVMVNTFGELAVNDTATRAWSDFSKMESQNIATYNFVYAVSVSIPVAFALLLNVNSTAKKIGLALYVVIGFVFLVSAKYTLSLLISAFLCYIAIFISSQKRTTKMLALVVTPLLLILLPYLIEFVALNVVKGGMQERLLEVAGYFTGEAMGYNLNGRVTLYEETLNAFIDSPIIGNSSLEFDGHATFLTVLSDVGLLGAIPFYWLYFSSRKTVNSILNNKTHEKCYLLAFMSVIMTGFVNPIHAALPLPMVAWLVVPLAVVVITNEKN